MNTIGKGWEAVEHENDRASRKYPSVDLAGTHMSLHVFQRDEDSDPPWLVWLNVDCDFTGLCIACGSTRDEAVADAVKGLEAAVARLQGPAWS